MRSPQSYYDKLAANYAEKRARLLKILEQAGFTVFKPRGAYYIMTDISRFPDPDPRRFAAGTKDVAFAQYLLEEISVAPAPRASFFNQPPHRAHQTPLPFLQQKLTTAPA